MRNPKTKERGFGTLEILLAIVVVVVLGVVGSLVYGHRHKSPVDNDTASVSSQSKPEKSTSANTPNAQTISTWPTHTSTIGGFSFQYPSDWSVTENQGGPGDQINVSSSASNAVSNGQSTPDVFIMTFNISQKPSSPFSPSRLQKGTIQPSPNGINLWTSSEASATDATAPTGRTVCPELLIVSADSSSFDYALPNGSYLNLEAGYCEGQGANTTLTYQEQLASQNWQDALAIAQSIKPQ